MVINNSQIEILKLFDIVLGLLFILVIGIAIFYPLTKNETLASTSLGVSTFLFGVFIAFSISDRHDRINSIRENDSIERGSLESLYNLLIVFGKNVPKKLTKKIDEYLMATLDYTIWDYNKTDKQFKNLVKVVTSLKVKNEGQAATYNSVGGIISGLTNARKKTISLIDERLSKLEWIVLFILGGVIVFSLLLIGTTTLQTVLVVLLITFTIMLLLVVLYRLDNLSWKEEVRIFEPYQQTFESIGLLRYYPEDVIKEGRVKKHKGKTYRSATYTNPYPDMKGKKVKIVKG